MSIRGNGSRLGSSRYGQYVSIVLLTLLGVALSAMVFLVAHIWERRAICSDFKSLADSRFQAITNTSDQIAKLISFADNVFLVGPGTDSPAFPGYVRSLRKFLEKDQTEYSAVHAVTWVPRVFRSEAAAYEQAARTVFDPRYRIHPSESSPQDCFPWYLSVGDTADGVQPGQDLSLDPAASKAMDQACRTGLGVAIAPMKLSDTPHAPLGYRVFHPLYRNGDPGNVEARVRDLAGFLCLDLDIGTLVANAFKDIKPQGIDVWVSDRTGRENTTLFRHVTRLGSLAVNPKAINHARDQLQTAEPINFFGRNVTLRAVSTPLFWEIHTIWQPWALLIVGLALTFTLAAHGASQTVRATAIEQAVSTRLAAFREEIDHPQPRRKEPASFPTNGVTRESLLGAPIDSGQTFTHPNESPTPM
ncbi:MAG TPA: CHASE domain-containing protein [Thermoguttaceae bacterium]|nr:CHASE domain-containing protein [Thermoguttaceae bacterium]